MANRVKLTVRLPEQNLDYLKRYAAEHGVTVTDVLERFLARLREGAEEQAIHPEVQKVVGLIPADIDARALYYEHLMEKHR
jgi:hypothetical protein